MSISPLRLTVGLSTKIITSIQQTKGHTAYSSSNTSSSSLSALLPRPDVNVVCEAVRYIVEVSCPAFVDDLVDYSLGWKKMHSKGVVTAVRLKYGPGFESIVSTANNASSISSLSSSSSSSRRNNRNDEVVVYVGMNDSQGRHLRPMDQLEHLVSKDEHITIMAYVDGWPGQRQMRRSRGIVRRIQRCDNDDNDWNQVGLVCNQDKEFLSSTTRKVTVVVPDEDCTAVSRTLDYQSPNAVLRSTPSCHSQNDGDMRISNSLERNSSIISERTRILENTTPIKTTSDRDDCSPWQTKPSPCNGDTKDYLTDCELYKAVDCHQSVPYGETKVKRINLRQASRQNGALSRKINNKCWFKSVRNRNTGKVGIRKTTALRDVDHVESDKSRSTFEDCKPLSREAKILIKEANDNGLLACPADISASQGIRQTRSARKNQKRKYSELRSFQDGIEGRNGGDELVTEKCANLRNPVNLAKDIHGHADDEGLLTYVIAQGGQSYPEFQQPDILQLLAAAKNKMPSTIFCEKRMESAPTLDQDEYDCDTDLGKEESLPNASPKYGSLLKTNRKHPQSYESANYDQKSHGDEDCLTSPLFTSTNHVSCNARSKLGDFQKVMNFRSKSPTLSLLKESCQSRGLVENGSKKDLMKRLESFNDILVGLNPKKIKRHSTSNVADKSSPSKRELKTMCEARGLSSHGSKSVLRHRLLSSYKTWVDDELSIESDSDFSTSVIPMKIISQNEAKALRKMTDS